MLKATHNSATGEPSTWWSIPLIPFARCQSKTFNEQVATGVTLFDIRLRRSFGKWRFAHGLWTSTTPVEELFAMLDTASKENLSFNLQPIRVELTFEGYNTSKYITSFLVLVEYLKRRFKNIKFGTISSKYTKGIKGVHYTTLLPEQPDFNPYKTVQKFYPLDGSNWRTYIPIPWLWKQYFFKEVEFSDEFYSYVDFV